MALAPVACGRRVRGGRSACRVGGWEQKERSPSAAPAAGTSLPSARLSTCPNESCVGPIRAGIVAETFMPKLAETYGFINGGLDGSSNEITCGAKG